jgi:hypothetical protein
MILCKICKYPVRIQQFVKIGKISTPSPASGMKVCAFTFIWWNVMYFRGYMNYISEATTPPGDITLYNMEGKQVKKGRGNSE